MDREISEPRVQHPFKDNEASWFKANEAKVNKAKIKEEKNKEDDRRKEEEEGK